MSGLWSLRAFAWAALLAFSTGAIADDEAGGWTIYPPMSPSEPPSGSSALRVSVVPGDVPESEILAFDGRAILRASPPSGYCAVPARHTTRHAMQMQYGVAREFDDVGLGLSVECAWFEDVSSYVGTGRHPAFLMLQPVYEGGVPLAKEIDRATFLETSRDRIGPAKDLDLSFDGEEEATSAVDRWMAEANAPRDSTEVARRIAGLLGRDANAFYVAVLTAGETREDTGDRRVIRAAVVGVTLINGFMVSVDAFSEIDEAADLRPLLDVAKLYARHLIEVNEGRQ